MFLCLKHSYSSFFSSVTHTHTLILSLIYPPLSPVKPNPPEKLTVAVMEDKSWPFLRASWEPPHKADTRSGWITLIYEIRVKLEEEHEWEVRNLGLEKSWRLNVLTSYTEGIENLPQGVFLFRLLECTMFLCVFWSL